MQLADVERLALETSKAYAHARIRLDPWQGIGLAQRLRDRGVSVEEWAFTSTSVGRLGASLHLLLRDYRLALPDDQDLLDELMTVRLRESAPGVYRLDHDLGQHDDRAVSLGLAALALTERTDSDLGSFTVPRGVVTRAGGRGGVLGLPWVINPAYAGRAIRGSAASAHAAQRAQTPGQRRAVLGLIVPGSANKQGGRRRRATSNGIESFS